MTNPFESPEMQKAEDEATWQILREECRDMEPGESKTFPFGQKEADQMQTDKWAFIARDLNNTLGEGRRWFWIEGPSRQGIVIHCTTPEKAPR